MGLGIDPLYSGEAAFAIVVLLVTFISLVFGDKDPFPEELPGWGDFRIGGTYREVVRGLHRVPIHLSGIFSLQRLAQTERLNR